MAGKMKEYGVAVRTIRLFFHRTVCRGCDLPPQSADADTPASVTAVIPASVTAVSPVSVISLVFIAVPMSFDAQTLNEVLPITIGSVVFIGVGELLAAKKGKAPLDRTEAAVEKEKIIV